MVDLLAGDGEVCGAVAWSDQDRRCIPIVSQAVLLATGGLGCVYRETTNPDVATGDGIAMAYRAGAEISDMEMIQFHPTALFLEGAPRFLLSEALRGEGAYLHNEKGERFMRRYSEQEELSARDVVSRAIVAELHRTPGAATCTGVHGANRLASNSLLEGIVYGARAGREIRESAGTRRLKPAIPQMLPPQPLPANGLFLLRQLAWRHIGIIRSGEGLQQGLDELEKLRPAFEKGMARNSRQGFEADNMFQLASLITRCALAREESRGCHYRTDFPEKRAAFQKHSRVSKNADLRFV